MNLLDLYRRDMRHIQPPPSAEEERELARRVRDGDRDARRDMIERNLPLVVSIAQRYRHTPMPMEDIIQAGNLGLIRAVDKFDPEKGFRFSTYAVWWMRDAIGRTLWCNRVVRPQWNIRGEDIAPECGLEEAPEPMIDDEVDCDIERFLAQLGGCERDAVVLRHVEEHSLSEVARCMGITPWIAGRYEQDGLRQLRRAMEVSA